MKYICSCCESQRHRYYCLHFLAAWILDKNMFANSLLSVSQRWFDDQICFENDWFSFSISVNKSKTINWDLINLKKNSGEECSNSEMWFCYKRLLLICLGKKISSQWNSQNKMCTFLLVHLLGLPRFWNFANLFTQLLVCVTGVLWILAHERCSCLVHGSFECLHVPCVLSKFFGFYC